MGTTPELVSKTEANYRVDSGDTPCSGCSNFIPPDACKLVAGKISETGTCDLYTPPDLNSMLFGGTPNG